MAFYSVLCNGNVLQNQSSRSQAWQWHPYIQDTERFYLPRKSSCGPMTATAVLFHHVLSFTAVTAHLLHISIILSYPEYYLNAIIEQVAFWIF